MSVHQHILNIHERKSRYALDRLIEAYNRGDISHEADLLSSVTGEYQSFYHNLAMPAITPEPLVVDNLLFVSSIKTPMIQLDEDLLISYEQLERLSEATKMIANLCSTESLGLSELINEASAAVSAVKLWASDSDPDYNWGGDTFTDLSKTDKAHTSSRVATGLGILTLPVADEIPLYSNISRIAITHPSTETYAYGMPGNSLEVSNVGWNRNPEEVAEPVNPTFTGAVESDSSNPAAMFDSDTNTWFEWEKYLLPVTQKCMMAGSAYVAAPDGELVDVIGPNGVTENYGFEYTLKWPDGTESIHWVVTPYTAKVAPDKVSDSLVLDMTIEFDTEQELSWVEITPYIRASLSSKNLKPARLISAKVSSNGSDNWVELVKDKEGIFLASELTLPVNYQTDGILVKDHKGIGVLSCPLPFTKAIKLKIVQDAPYLTKIGHQYYLKTTMITEKKKRPWGSKTKTKPEETRVPNQNMTSSSGGRNGFLGLWGKSKTITDLEVNTYYDIFDCYRYYIGIKELGLYKRVYAESSVYTSKAHYFKKPVKAVSIIASQDIPESWGNTQAWITYQVSPDGTTWYDLNPQNSDETASSVANFNQETTRVFVRIILKRPKDRISETPVINYYAIKAI